MKQNLKDLYLELAREDGDVFRSKLIGLLFPDIEEASKRLNSRLDRHYEQRFIQKGF